MNSNTFADAVKRATTKSANQVEEKTTNTNPEMDKYWLNLPQLIGNLSVLPQSRAKGKNKTIIPNINILKCLEVIKSEITVVSTLRNGQTKEEKLEELANSDYYRNLQNQKLFYEVALAIAKKMEEHQEGYGYGYIYDINHIKAMKNEKIKARLLPIFEENIKAGTPLIFIVGVAGITKTSSNEVVALEEDFGEIA